MVSELKRGGCGEQVLYFKEQRLHEDKKGLTPFNTKPSPPGSSCLLEIIVEELWEEGPKVYCLLTEQSSPQQRLILLVARPPRLPRDPFLFRVPSHPSPWAHTTQAEAGERRPAKMECTQDGAVPTSPWPRKSDSGVTWATAGREDCVCARLP